MPLQNPALGQHLAMLPSELNSLAALAKPVLAHRSASSINAKLIAEGVVAVGLAVKLLEAVALLPSIRSGGRSGGGSAGHCLMSPW